MSTWPRIYNTTLTQRMAMSSTELENLWQEYREYWRGAEKQQIAGDAWETLQKEYQADWLEDYNGLYR